MNTTDFSALPEAALAACTTRNLPARSDVTAAARLLGFSTQEIQILMSAGKLMPLGDPAPNAPKWFATVDLLCLVADRGWLHKATKEVSKYWRQKRERRHRTSEFHGQKSTPKSTPKEPSTSVDGVISGSE